MTIALTLLMPQLQRAQALLQSGQSALAWPVMAPLRTAIDGNGQALRLYALAAQSAGRIDEAIDALKRIAALEGQPIDILGAIADTLGNAGRHTEAYEHWGALIARDPGIVDAHLNRAIAAANAGLHDEALTAADAGLKRFPGDARLLATRAMALKNANRILESLPAFEKAVAADPKRALTRHNQAVALRVACRYDEACDAYAAAERLGMAGVQFYSNWAAAELESGRVDAAAQLYRKALADDPAHEESLRALARLEIEYHGGEEAFAHYETSVEKRGFAAEAYFDWIDALMRNNRPAEAAEAASQALDRHPDHPKLRTLKPFLKGMIAEEPGSWLDELEREAERHPGDIYLMDSIQVLAIRAQRWARAEELLRHQLARDPENQIAWAKLSLIWRLLDDPREHWLCDYDRLVMVTEVPSPDGLDPAEYARHMATLLDPLHQTLHAPGDQTLRGGTQSSGTLFARPEPEIQQFRKDVLQAAQEMIGSLPDDPEHPFLRRKSMQLDIVGSWSVRLRKGGHHVSHVHHEGWMSSAYYARLPQAASTSSKRQDGWIHFGVPPENYGIELEPRRIVEPKPGRLVLFPSYMWHGTVPFTDGDRLTAAFDFQPL